MPEDFVILDSFKDGAFRLAINHNIPVVPMTFLDNKKRFPFTFFAGSPGPIRVKVHSFFDTSGMHEGQKAELREEVRGIILNELRKDQQGFSLQKQE